MKEMNVFPTTMILGSTGSVGEQAVDVAKKQKIPILALSARNHWRRVAEQARELSVKAVAMIDENAARELAVSLSDTSIRVYSGENGLLEMIHDIKSDFAVNAILGEAGLAPTLAVLDSGKNLALANKESLVVAGDIVMTRAKEKGLRITPVDSEHCAIDQCLRSGVSKEVKRLILTASGGPFFGKKTTDLANVTVEDALAHPTWRMGAKITVDSATMMNKGFEVIEAAHLFGIPADRIDVLVHRESIIHSMVDYIDNSIIAEMSVPDMRLCVQYALTSPARTEAVIPSLDLATMGSLTFARPDEKTFPLLPLARRMWKAGGGCPAVLNAANEVAVAAFLNHRISLLQLFETVCRVTDDMPRAAAAKTLEEILAADREARERAMCLLT